MGLGKALPNPMVAKISDKAQWVLTIVRHMNKRVESVFVSRIDSSRIWIYVIVYLKRWQNNAL